MLSGHQETRAFLAAGPMPPAGCWPPTHTERRSARDRGRVGQLRNQVGGRSRSAVPVHHSTISREGARHRGRPRVAPIFGTRVGPGPRGHLASPVRTGRRLRPGGLDLGSIEPRAVRALATRGHQVPVPGAGNVGQAEGVPELVRQDRGSAPSVPATPNGSISGWRTAGISGR